MISTKYHTNSGFLEKVRKQGKPKMNHLYVGLALHLTVFDFKPQNNCLPIFFLKFLEHFGLVAVEAV